MSAGLAELLALLDSDPATGILVAADELEHEAGRCADAEGAFRWTDPADGARLVEWMRATARGWRGVVERHREVKPSLIVTQAFASAGTRAEDFFVECTAGCSDWPCPDLTQTVTEARAFLGGKP